MKIDPRNVLKILDEEPYPYKKRHTLMGSRDIQIAMTEPVYRACMEALVKAMAECAGQEKKPDAHEGGVPKRDSATERAIDAFMVAYIHNDGSVQTMHRNANARERAGELISRINEAIGEVQTGFPAHEYLYAKAGGMDGPSR